MIEFTSNLREQTLLLVGVPWKDTGDDVTGCYCVGLVCLWYRLLGIQIPNPLTTNPDDVTAQLIRYFYPHNLDKKTGDVIAMPGEISPVEGHVGIWTPIGILHATRAAGVVLVDEKKIKIRGVYRLRDGFL